MTDGEAEEGQEPDMTYWSTEDDRRGFRLIVEAKLNELRGIAPADDTFTPGTADYPFAAILVAGLMGCVSEGAITEALEFDPGFVSLVGARLRASHIWSESEYVASGQIADDDEGGAVAFFLHLAVARGDMKMNEAGGFTITELGKQRVRGMKRDRP